MAQHHLPLDLSSFFDLEGIELIVNRLGPGVDFSQEIAPFVGVFSDIEAICTAKVIFLSKFPQKIHTRQVVHHGCYPTFRSEQQREQDQALGGEDHPPMNEWLVSLLTHLPVHVAAILQPTHGTGIPGLALPRSSTFGRLSVEPAAPSTHR
jgi:hypothetical protein